MENNKVKNIHWFPGHMKKASNLISEKLKLVDFVIVLLDSRIPLSSYNPYLMEIIKDKKKVFLLSKKDLSDENESKKWEKYLTKNNDLAMVVDLKNQKIVNDILSLINVYIDDELLEVFRGNGLCVSTPSGSTAYNKSIGGAVIYPGTPLMQLTEVAPIQHNAYRSLGASMILDANRVIKLESNHFKCVSMGIDNLHFDFSNVEKIEIRIATKTVNFIEYRSMSFIQRIRRAFICE